MSIRVKIDQELADLIPIFMNNREHDVVAITTALQQGDYETVRVIGHTLKGIGGGYGFITITDLGAAIEQAAKAQDAKRTSELLEALKDYLENVEIVYE